jgi:glutaredoxin-related protein
MIINVKNLEDILDDRISLVGRGILITILLLREKDPKLTLAKCKTKISFLKNKEELISLHKLGFITWSGYVNAVESLKKKEVSPQVTDILNFMSNLYRKGISPTEERSRLLHTLLEKYSVDEIKMVVSNRYVVWKDEPVMCKHLVPETIFRLSKFVKYLEEANHTKEGESFLTASNISLNEGDEITLEIVNRFSDQDTYTVISYELNNEGEKITRGSKITRYGKDLKQLLKIRDNQEQKDFMLIYTQK